jgi:hypothetical protein
VRFSDFESIRRRSIGVMTATHRTAALLAGLALLLTGCTATVRGSGSPAGSTGTGPPSAPGTTAGNGLVPYQGDHFTVSMPGTPVKATQQISTTAGTAALVSLTVTKRGNTFFVAYADFPPGTPFDLDGAARGAARNVNGQLADVKRTRYRGSAAIDFRIIKAGGGGTGFQRVFVADGRLYELLAIVPGSDVKTPPAEYPLMRDSLTF